MMKINVILSCIDNRTNLFNTILYLIRFRIFFRSFICALTLPLRIQRQRTLTNTQTHTHIYSQRQNLIQKQINHPFYLSFQRLFLPFSLLFFRDT